MTVEIRPEDEKLIEENLRSGAFRSVEELIHRALAYLPAMNAPPRVAQSTREPDLRKAYEDLRAEMASQGLRFLEEAELEREIAERKGSRS